MQAYETSGTVENEGQLHVEGVPFPPGTRVEVTISPQRRTAADSADAWQRLSEALNKGRNDTPIGPLRREELYDRDDIH